MIPDTSAGGSAADPFRLDGKRILVTGASSGIGRATSVLLSEPRARLVIAGRDEARLGESYGELRGSSHVMSIFDLSRIGDMDGWLDGIVAQGPLDGLVNCAGILMVMPIRAVSESSVRRIDRHEY